MHIFVSENVCTVVSIFVNLTQFSPKEDLTIYLRTLTSDLEMLSAAPDQTPSALSLPFVQEMYPSGIMQEKEMEKGSEKHTVRSRDGRKVMSDVFQMSRDRRH